MAGAAIIQLICSSITAGDITAVTRDLQRLPLGVIAKDQADTLLTWFLNHAAKSNDTEAVRAIISAFDVARIRVDPLPAITNMFLNPTLTRETLSFVLASFPEKTPLDFYVDLINMGDDASALKVAGILATFFPGLKNDDWNLLVKMTDNVEEEEYENQMLRAYFQARAAETGQYASRPQWIRDGLLESIIEPTPELPLVNEAIDLLLGGLKQTGLRLAPESKKEFSNELREVAIAQYAISTISRKIKMLSVVHPVPDFDDTTLFQEFGPVNTIYTTSSALIEPTHVCAKHGGCRMLLCNEFEQMTADGDDIDCMAEEAPITDWFRGSCDNCLKKIKQRHYAIRQPLRHGGWRGCYCSVECLVEKCTLGPIEQVLLERVQDQLEEIGIRER